MDYCGLFYVIKKYEEQSNFSDCRIKSGLEEGKSKDKDRIKTFLS